MLRVHGNNNKKKVLHEYEAERITKCQMSAGTGRAVKRGIVGAAQQQKTST